MSCNTMRDLEYEKEREEERKRKRKKEEEAKIQREKIRKRLLLQKKRREKAEKTIRELAEKMQWKLKEFEFHPGSFHMYKPGSNDKFKLDIMEDGVVRADLRGVFISPQNHPAMEAFFNNLRDTLKGTWRTVAKGLTSNVGHAHSHTHGHAHTHTH